MTSEQEPSHTYGSDINRTLNQYKEDLTEQAFQSRRIMREGREAALHMRLSIRTGQLTNEIKIYE